MHPDRARRPPGGRRRHLPAFSFFLLAALVACLGLAACGGSGSGDPGGEAAGRQAAEQKSVKFAKCLREHGVDAETGTGPNGRGFSMQIKVGGGGSHTGGPESSKSGGPPPQIARAMEACKKYRPAPKLQELSPAEKAKQAQKALEFARCMRSHGVQVPDPGPSGVLELNDVNPQSATFESAQKACQHLMGKLPLAIRAQNGGPPPGGAGGGGGQSNETVAPAGGGEK